MKFPLWTIIPAVFVLTLLYFALGSNGYWRYSENDLIYGNLLCALFIGKIYAIEKIYGKVKK